MKLPATKYCKKCDLTKTSNSFSYAKKSADKLQTYCKECKLKIQRAVRQKQKDKKLHDSHVSYYYVILNKRLYSAKWRRENPGEVKAQITRRKLKRSRCLWANRSEITSIYAIRDWLNYCTGGIYFHVDHIIPLQGELVSGLHVENNLAVIPASDNLRKNNKYD